MKVNVRQMCGDCRMIPVGINVDGIVTANPLHEVDADGHLGYSSYSVSLNPKVMFASFSDSSFVTYSDYNRVFMKENTKPLVFPSHTETYPDSSGVGVGNGLKYNTGMLVIRCEVPLCGIRVKPACSLLISVSSSLTDTRRFVGSTSLSSNGVTSELLFSETSWLIVEHVGHLSLREVELFSCEAPNLSFALFPMLKNGKTLPYLQSSMNDLKMVRRGGLQNELFNIVCTDISTEFEYMRISSKVMYNLPVEELYLEESNVHDHILQDVNKILPIVSLIERNCIKHQKRTQESIKSINSSERQTLEDVQCVLNCELVANKLFINTVAAPSRVELVSGVKYVFTPEGVEINGSTVSEIVLSEGQSVVYGKNESTLGILHGVKAITTEMYELPEHFMNETSLDDILSDISSLSEGLTESLTPLYKTPNSGNTITHAAFIHETGEALTCEESIFLSGETKSISVFCSDTNFSVQIFIDDELKTEVNVAEERVKIIELKLPLAPGVHALSTTHGSNVLFRISEKSIVHAPVHPRYYTSGQVEFDEFSSSSLTFVAQHNNFDLLMDPTMIAISSSSLITIDDVVFSDFSCVNALCCRKGKIDLKDVGVSYDQFESDWDFCSEHPWLACLNVQNGCTVIHSQIELRNFSFWWFPTSLHDVTMIQGQTSVFIRNGKLISSNAENTFECDVDSLDVSVWNHIVFTNGSFIVNGILKPTHTSDQLDRIRPNSTVIGTCYKINLKPVLSDTPGDVQLPEFARDRLNECRMIVQSAEAITSFQMTTSAGIFTWTNTAEGVMPMQLFKLDAPLGLNISFVSGLSLPFSISVVNMQFTPCGYLRNICNYSDVIPDVVIQTSRSNRDTVIDFQLKSAVATCTNQEQNTVKSEHYTQSNSTTNGTMDWIVHSVMSSIYVTPPSLIMMSTSQNTPYSINQSLLILFNRRIEVFLRDESELFSISGTDGSTMIIRAKHCTLLSSQISIPNSFLELSPATTYTIHIARARLFQYEGHVPCIERSIQFSTQ